MSSVELPLCNFFPLSFGFARLGGQFLLSYIFGDTAFLIGDLWRSRNSSLPQILIIVDQLTDLTIILASDRL